MELLIKVDGGAQPNPGHGAAAAVAYELRGSTQPVSSASFYLGEGVSNNVAEHSAILLALRLGRNLGADGVVVQSDSKLAVNHFNGEWKASGRQLAPLVEHERAAARKYRRGASVVWVPRAQISEAHHLVQEELGRRGTSNRKKRRQDSVARVAADVSSFLRSAGVPVLQQTRLAVFTPGAAIVPVAHHYGGHPVLRPDVWADATALLDTMPVWFAWRPYGDSDVPLPAAEVQVAIGRRGARDGRGGGCELLMAPAEALTGVSGPDAHFVLLSGVWSPAREAAWWTDGL